MLVCGRFHLKRKGKNDKYYRCCKIFNFLSYTREQYSLTCLKLQRLLYLAQGWSYVWDNKPLFDDVFIAYLSGPVSPIIQSLFGDKYCYDEILKEESISCLQNKDARTTLEAIWREYGSQTKWTLNTLVNKQHFWQSFQKTSNKIIPNESIKEYFRNMYCQ